MSPTNHPSTPTLHLGLCMAGAVSAGAYTAGVVDYLIETLERWENAKGEPDIPKHNVKISLLSGASAGGMTAIIAARALHGDIVHLSPDKRDYGDAQKANMLYDAWVNMTQRDGQEMTDQLLSLSDLPKEKPVQSVLNGSFIDELALKILKDRPDTEKVRPYVDEDLDVLVTLSNLDGIPIKIEFSSSNEGQGNSSDQKSITLKKHMDFAHFSVQKGGNADLWGRIPVDFSKALDQSPELELMRNAAMATGAFPIGLPFRFLNRGEEYLEGNPVLEAFLGGKIQAHSHNNLMVDGGMLYNEPYEISKDILKHKLSTRYSEGKHFAEENNVNDFNFSILLIDPFPYEIRPPKEDKNARDTPSFGLGKVVPKILSALMSSSIFPPQFLTQVLETPKKDYRVFLIGPSREKELNAKARAGLTEDRDDGALSEATDLNGANALASGCLAGFSGFLDKEFRRHDYFLGRRNCQRFLAKHFVVPLENENPLFGEEFYPAKAKERFSIEKAGKKYLHIIPDTNFQRAEKNQFIWKNEEKVLAFPHFDAKNILTYRKPLLQRLEAIVIGLLPMAPWFKNAVVWGAFRLYGKKIFIWLARGIFNRLVDWGICHSKDAQLFEQKK